MGICLGRENVIVQFYIREDSTLYRGVRGSRTSTNSPSHLLQLGACADLSADRFAGGFAAVFLHIDHGEGQRLQGPWQREGLEGGRVKGGGEGG